MTMHCKNSDCFIKRW